MRLPLAAGVLLAVDVLLALCFPAHRSSAGTAPRLELTELAREASLVLEARVLSTQPVELDGLLATECLLEVGRTFKGQPDTLRVVRIPGGVRADGSGLLIPGMPSLVPGEELLLFLSAESRNGLRLPTGLAQGKFGIQRLADGRKRLTRDLADLRLVGPARADRAVVDYAECVAALEAALGQPEPGARR